MWKQRCHVFHRYWQLGLPGIKILYWPTWSHWSSQKDQRLTLIIYGRQDHHLWRGRARDWSCKLSRDALPDNLRSGRYSLLVRYGLPDKTSNEYRRHWSMHYIHKRYLKVSFLAQTAPKTMHSKMCQDVHDSSQYGDVYQRKNYRFWSPSCPYQQRLYRTKAQPLNWQRFTHW